MMVITIIITIMITIMVMVKWKDKNACFVWLSNHLLYNKQ